MNNFAANPGLPRSGAKAPRIGAVTVSRIAAALLVATISAAACAQTDFQRDIRPLLADRCFHCHGPDAGARKADLRLDVRAGATAQRDDGAAIVPGDAGRSLMLQRLRSTDPEVRMPPPESGLRVTPEEIARLEAWIEAGAEYAEHWSFVPPRRPDVAANAHPVDAFVDARLVKRGLVKSPAADRETLIRRVTFDLTGLPPTTAEIDAFLADTSEDAYARVVERLLASPHFGERMAADWMDVARYADTYGYQNDRERRVWPWRDWLIGAFNDNLPFDQFLTWQIAGDMLPDATQSQRLATTFCRLHRQTNEGGSVEEEMRIEYVADRTQTIATAFLGLTLECARCHDHKFDPLSQREYYELTAFFDNIDESGLYSHFTNAVPTPSLLLSSEQQRAQQRTHREEIAAAEAARQALRPTRRAAFDAWRETAESTLSHGLLGYYRFDDPKQRKSKNEAGEKPAVVAGANAFVEGRVGHAVRLTGDDPIRLGGIPNFGRHVPFSISLWIRAPKYQDRMVVLHRSRAWTDAASQGYELLLLDGHLQFSLIHFWPGNAASIRATERIAIGEFTHVALRSDGSSRAAGLSLFVDGEPVATTTVRDSLQKAITGGGGELAIGERFRDKGFAGGDVDEVRVYARELANAEVAALARLQDSAVDFDAYLLAIDSEWAKATEAVHAARDALGTLVNRTPEIMAMREMATPRQTYVRARGRYDAPTDPVEPATPACLPPFPDDLPRTRLGLAQWMTRPDHPLTARVAVNRLWQLVFGVGLVATPDDFGSQGANPTHPELLDWLANEFTRDWDIQRLLTLLVTSETYKRSSRAHPDTRERDPDNLWLARGPSHRLPAEMVRDQALAASGLLVRKIGGGPARPYQPAGLWKEKSGQTYRTDKGDGLYRRSLYTIWKRTSPPPSAMIFDAAKRDVCVARRQVTNTPLQALVLLNDVQYVEAARHLAARTLEADTDDAARLRSMFRALTSRAPTDAELAILERMRTRTLESFSTDPARAQELLAVGHTKSDAKHDPALLATWTTVANALMNYDATVTKR